MTNSNPKLSIIIPVFNEANYIGLVLDHIRNNSSKENIEEIIVVDGGSTDASLNVISEYEDVNLLQSKRGRAIQLNHGAKIAKGCIFYFLHADSFPPEDFDKIIINEIIKNYCGSFRLKFEKAEHLLLKLSQWLTKFNFQLFRGGDQSLFIKKDHFEILNGYNENYIIYEDVELINRIYKKFNFKVYNDFIITSERKFREIGIWKLHYHFLMIHIKNWFGASPEELNKYYLKNIKVNLIDNN